MNGLTPMHHTTAALPRIPRARIRPEANRTPDRAARIERTSLDRRAAASAATRSANDAASSREGNR